MMTFYLSSEVYTVVYFSGKQESVGLYSARNSNRCAMVPISVECHFDAGMIGIREASHKYKQLSVCEKWLMSRIVWL